MKEIAMENRRLSHLTTGVLFVAPGQIMDPSIMKLRHYPDHVSRLKADIGLDALETDLESKLAERPRWSFDHLWEQIGQFFYRRGPAPT